MENIENVADENITTVDSTDSTENIEEVAAVSVVDEPKPTFGAKVKEWFRKQIVNLKRKPQNIAFVLLLITSVFYLLSLSTLSPGPVTDFSTVSWLGFCIFVNALFSILVLVLYLGIFPKYPKVNKKTGKKRRINIAMIVLTAIFLAVMVAMDIWYYTILVNTMSGNEAIFFSSAAEAQKYQQYLSEGFDVTTLDGNTSARSYLITSLHITIAHIVLVAITAILIATLPLYKRLILKINTAKKIESGAANMELDIED